MCSVHPWSLAAAAFLTAAAGLTAQAPAPQELEARIDSLLPIHKRAKARARVADSLASLARLKKSAVETEELSVGPLTVLVVKGQAGRARAVMGEAWERYEPFVDGPARELFQGHVFTFQVHRGRAPNIYVEAPDKLVHRVEIRTFYGQRALREKAGGAVSQVLNAALDPELRGWGGFPAPGELRADDRLYRDVVTTPSRAVRRCLDGDVALCWEAAGAVPSEGDPWERLYGPMDRMELVRRAGRPFVWGSQGREELPLYEACLREGSEDACLAFARRHYGDNLVPLSHPARAALLKFAVERGGEGAFTRLMESRGEIRDRLARAARMDPDELMTAWLARVEEARPNRNEGEPATRWAALFWVLAFGFLATRSTRWRLG